MIPQCHSGGSYTIYFHPPPPRNPAAPSGFTVSLAADKQISSPNDSQPRMHASKRTAEMCTTASATDYKDQSSKAAKHDPVPDQCLKQFTTHDLSEVWNFKHFKEAPSKESQPAKETVSLRVNEWKSRKYQYLDWCKNRKHGLLSRSGTIERNKINVWVNDTWTELRKMRREVCF